MEIGERLQSRYAEQAGAVALNWLADAMDLANACELNYRNAQNKRLHVELCLMQIASLHFDGKKKGSLIPTSFFQERATKPVATPHPQAHSLLRRLNRTTKKKLPNRLPHLFHLPKNQYKPCRREKVSSFSLASIQKKKEWEEKQKTDTVEDNCPKMRSLRSNSTNYG